LLAALAVQAHRRGGRERDIGNADADHLGNPGAGVVEQREHDPVPAARPSRRVRGCEQGLNLVTREKPEQGPLEALHGYREDLLSEL
jgi:hypothetical protein